MVDGLHGSDVFQGFFQAKSWLSAGTYTCSEMFDLKPVLIDMRDVLVNHLVFEGEHYLGLGLARHEGPVRLLFVGGAFGRKGGADLLAAVESVQGDVELDLVTTERPEVDGARFPIRIHRGLRPQSDELLRLYREADIFVLPARGDCLPQAIAEAMACGLPVVSTTVGAIPEMVVDGETGLLVTPGSPARLAEAISRLAGDRALRQAMGRAGLQVARRDHDMCRNNRSVLDLMAAVAKRRHAVARLA